MFVRLLSFWAWKQRVMDVSPPPPTPNPPLLQWSDYIQHEFLKERREGEEVRILGEAIRRDGGDSREDRFKPMFGNFKAHACKFPPANFNKSQINA